jgi:hypothetical protein
MGDKSPSNNSRGDSRGDIPLNLEFYGKNVLVLKI